jgi:hypothetical protein
LLPLSVGVVFTVSIIRREERLFRFPTLMDRRGEASESVSEELRSVIVGGGGEPLDFFDKNPAWKRFDLGLISIEDSGGVRTGDESLESFELFEISEVRYVGKVGKTTLSSSVETSGGDSIF